jgi:hypothetical protein
MSLEHRGLPAPGQRPLEKVARYTANADIRMIDGMEIRGTVYLPPRMRVIDLLNREAEDFIAITNAELVMDGGRRTEFVNFIAVNKTHIATLREPGQGQLPEGQLQGGGR